MTKKDLIIIEKILNLHVFDYDHEWIEEMEQANFGWIPDCEIKKIIKLIKET